MKSEEVLSQEGSPDCPSSQLWLQVEDAGETAGPSPVT